MLDVERCDGSVGLDRQVDKLEAHRAAKEGQRAAGAEISVPDVAASFQEAVVDVLTRKTLAAAKETGAKTIVVAGGVACNSVLRERFERLTPPGVRLRLAARKYCTDNAGMIAITAYFKYLRGEFCPIDIPIQARWVM